ncbi:MAG TPA: hypothetical protein VFD38_13810 [Myxococcaceae bacterium]|nr:hypothetical protein [Myxococcaceae bacterium]
MPDSTRPSPGAVLLAAFVVAAADLLDAIVVWVVIFQRSTVQRILQSVAAGVLGPDSYRGGNATAALGLLLHIVIALGWTLGFLVLLLRWPRLRAWTASTRGTVLVGLLYGAAVWLLMDGVVLPLSRARVTPPTVPWFWIQLATHPFVVGLPIALILGRSTRHAAAVTPARLQEAAGGNG